MKEMLVKYAPFVNKNVYSHIWTWDFKSKC